MHQVPKGAGPGQRSSRLGALCVSAEPWCACPQAGVANPCWRPRWEPERSGATPGVSAAGGRCTACIGLRLGADGLGGEIAGHRASRRAQGRRGSGADCPGQVAPLGVTLELAAGLAHLQRGGERVDRPGRVGGGGVLGPTDEAAIAARGPRIGTPEPGMALDAREVGVGAVGQRAPRLGAGQFPTDRTTGIERGATPRLDAESAEHQQ